MLLYYGSREYSNSCRSFWRTCIVIMWIFDSSKIQIYGNLKIEEWKCPMLKETWKFECFKIYQFWYPSNFLHLSWRNFFLTLFNLKKKKERKPENFLCKSQISSIIKNCLPLSIFYEISKLSLNQCKISDTMLLEQNSLEGSRNTPKELKKNHLAL